MPSDELTERVRKGDASALAEWIEESRPELIRIIQHICQARLLSVVTVEDLLQEVAASALVALPKIAGPDLDPQGWLKQLARRRVVDAYRFHFGAERRSKNRVQELGGVDASQGWEQWIVASLTSASEVLSRDGRLFRMHQALAELGPEAEEAIRLRYLDGLPTREIAQQMNKSDVAIRVLLSRSLQRLQKMLGDNAEGTPFS